MGGNYRGKNCGSPILIIQFWYPVTSELTFATTNQKKKNWRDKTCIILYIIVICTDCDVIEIKTYVKYMCACVSLCVLIEPKDVFLFSVKRLNFEQLQDFTSIKVKEASWMRNIIGTFTHAFFNSLILFLKFSVLPEMGYCVCFITLA